MQLISLKIHLLINRIEIKITTVSLNKSLSGSQLLVQQRQTTSKRYNPNSAAGTVPPALAVVDLCLGQQT